MTKLRISIATLAAVASLTLFSAARAEAVPTPAPGGTPVTFLPTKAIGSPLPVAPAQPIATTVPTTSPDGKSTSYENKREAFVVGDYLLQPKVYNELSHGQQSHQAEYALRGAGEFDFLGLPVMLEGETRHYAYRHEDGFVTNAGRTSQTFVPGEEVRDNEISGHVGIKLLEPRIYIALAYLNKNSTKDFVQLVGPGVGIEKLPDYEAPLGVYFSAYFYPNLVGAQTSLNSFGAVRTSTLRYRELNYQLGFTVAPGKSPIFIDLGALGDKMFRRTDSPSSETHLSAYGGVGFFAH